MEENNSLSALTLKNLKFTYAGQCTPAVNGIDFEVKKGEFVSIIGHNGSGKSTLARLINGLLDAESGYINVLGYTLCGGTEQISAKQARETIREIRKRVGIVFQNPDNQMVASIVEDDVAFGPENIGVERQEIARRVDWALKAVGMEQYKSSTPSRLSGGQKQRIAVAGVLAVKPEILILDESTAMLDPKGRREVIEVVQRLNKEEGITVILITHFMEEALLADRCAVLNRGEIVISGTPKEIFENGEMLSRYNLCLPQISVICNDLRNENIRINDVLRPEELAEEIKRYAESCGIFGGKTAPFEPDKNSVGGEWDIEIENLNYVYSKKSPFAAKALDGVDLTVKEGEFFGIIGHTGSGKSTLIQHINALIKLPQACRRYRKPKAKKGLPPPVESSICVGIFNLASRKCDFSALRANVGMVFQYPEYQLFAETVFADVAFGLKNFNKNLKSEEIETAVRESLEIVGLDYEEVKDKSPFDLSGGQKRRVAIAGVIVTKPHILILDEPAAGLDPLGKKEIMELLHKLHKEWCKTVIIVSHDMDEVAENCTRAAVIANGKVALCDAPHKLFSERETLNSLGLDVPLVYKVKNYLSEYGYEIDCDCTIESFSKKATELLKGVTNA